MLIVLVLAQSTIVFAGLVFLGLVLSHRVGLGTPFISARVAGATAPGFAGVALQSLLIGLTSGVVIFLLDRWAFGRFIEAITRAQDQAVWWSRLLACIYGGIDEEVAMRYALMTLLVWVGWRIRRTPDEKPTAVGVWIPIVVASVVMGLMHLPMSGHLAVVTPLVVVRAVVLNSVVAIPCGWFYWRHGLESAMAIHFGCDLALHSLLPLIIP
ncbi:MAG TPA: CPBP family glutamic-type intramembrane protease [Vicinamibacteria bacterium]|nr:CPBP family glutamic-type intramembrane protease [Vicinamibacteria bacterium]